MPSSEALFGLYHVLEDQVRASKEAMIQVTLMTKRLKDVYDASLALVANVRVSAIVSVFALVFLHAFGMLIFYSGNF